MKLSLTKGLEEDQLPELGSQFVSSRLFREQLKKVLQDKINAAQISMRDLEAYSNSSWPMYQADKIGQIRAYEDVIDLLN